ncbi:hypothetical protein [Paracoccus marcusii]|uniref:hypothetical protein n=1 Tax=Paracoccus marcusii TaxID=59779 RepID=UPI00142F5A79|nr:hypothetical protein [Paracoccus marcusii]
MSRPGPTKEQTLAALARVSRGEVWNHTPQPDHWRSVGDLDAEQVWKKCEAAE